jgi:hypothetical protein
MGAGSPGHWRPASDVQGIFWSRMQKRTIERRTHYDQHEAIPQVRLLKFRLRVRRKLPASGFHTSTRFFKFLNEQQSTSTSCLVKILKVCLMLERCQEAFR